MQLFSWLKTTTKINPFKVGDTVIGNDPEYNIVHNCVGIVTRVTTTYQTEEDYDNKTNPDITYVCDFDRGTYLLKEHQMEHWEGIP